MSAISEPGESDGGSDKGTTPARIAGYRRAEPSDVPRLERLVRPTTREIFGDARLERLYETSCLSVVQYDEEHNVVSGVCLCNYPNVPSVPPCDWLSWLRTIYE
ncbi:hypothetical protein DMN91_008438 [Ooceraea biroi]|uniref:Cilia- and flagella-associated protein 61 N-terminal domain-containing protein n=1 Tax=Ooceraea biroi TaxID=2015173 RepID=A0A3L8DIX1_OOCBI|nr:hypothetical protein DMN91_008438 [Ooceraea biroi]